MLSIAYGILVGSLMAIVYVPLFIIFYKQYFYVFDQHKLRHIAHKVEASLISSDYTKFDNNDIGYINTFDYYCNGRRHSYKMRTNELLDNGSKILLYYISNSSKAREYEKVGGKEHIPLLKIYITAWIYSVTMWVFIYLLHIDMHNRILLFGLLSLVAQVLVYISFSVIYNITEFIKKLLHGDKVEEVDAILVKEGKPGIISNYIYQYYYRGKVYSYKIKSLGNEEQKIKLYIDGSPRKAKVREVVGNIKSMSWSRTFIIVWFIISLILFAIFIR